MTTNDTLDLDETIHQPTRLRIMTLLAAQGADERVAYGFVQKELGLTGGNLTAHLRKLEDAGFIAMSKEFIDAKPRTWIEATDTGRQAYARYLDNLRQALNLPPPRHFSVNETAQDQPRLLD